MNSYVKIQILLCFYAISQLKKQVDVKKNKSIETTKPKKEKHFSDRHKVDFYKSLLNMDKKNQLYRLVQRKTYLQNHIVLRSNSLQGYKNQSQRL